MDEKSYYSRIIPLSNSLTDEDILIIVKSKLKLHHDKINLTNVNDGRYFVTYLYESGKTACAFDLDCTAATGHSKGIQIHGENDERIIKYCESPSIPFLIAVVILNLCNFHIGILTFTDEAYHLVLEDHPKSHYTAGVPLIKRFLNTNFTEDIVKNIFCYGYMPDLHHTDRNKLIHLNKFKNHCGDIKNEQIVMFDDSKANLYTGKLAYAMMIVDKKKAFQFADLNKDIFEGYNNF